MKRNTPDHPKMKSLAKKLGIPRYAAVGIMETLWNFTADYCPDGGIGRYSDEELADALDWRGSPAELLGMLAECRWLDVSRTCRFVIHDWAEHADDNVHAKLSRSLKYFADGTTPKLTKLNKTEKEAAEQFYSAEAQKNSGGSGPANNGTPEEFHGCTALPFPSLPFPSITEKSAPPSATAPVASVDDLVSEIVAEMKKRHAKKSGLGGTELERALCAAVDGAANQPAVLRSIRDRWRVGCEREWHERKPDMWPNLCRWIRERGYLDPAPELHVNGGLTRAGSRLSEMLKGL